MKVEKICIVFYILCRIVNHDLHHIVYYIAHCILWGIVLKATAMHSVPPEQKTVWGPALSTGVWERKALSKCNSTPPRPGDTQCLSNALLCVAFTALHPPASIPHQIHNAAHRLLGLRMRSPAIPTFFPLIPSVQTWCPRSAFILILVSGQGFYYHCDDYWPLYGYRGLV